MVKNSKSKQKGTKSSKGQFGDGYFSKHKGKALEDTEHHARMGHVVSEDGKGTSSGGASPYGD